MFMLLDINSCIDIIIYINIINYKGIKIMSKDETTSRREQTAKRKPALSQTDLPSVKLSEALRIPLGIRDNYALNPSTPLDVGTAIGIAPTSGSFRTLTGASIAFGLTTGGYNAAEISLTELGKRIVAPSQEGDDVLAKREAFERPRVIREFIQKYDGNKLPQKNIVQNVLNNMKVPFEATERAYDLLIAGLNELGYIKLINNASFVQRPNEVRAASNIEQPLREITCSTESDAAVDNITVREPELTELGSRLSNAIFLGHGKNKKPLEQLIKILDEYGIPHLEAEHEPNAGRPIPTKVAETMRKCGAAILIFTGDERFTDSTGNEVLRPSENVVHELGAASVLYDNRIIIFKEADVNLASNYSSIGYIDFDKDKLNDKGLELFRELVNFKIINISVAN